MFFQLAARLCRQHRDGFGGLRRMPSESFANQPGCWPAAWNQEPIKADGSMRFCDAFNIPESSPLSRTVSCRQEQEYGGIIKPRPPSCCSRPRMCNGAQVTVIPRKAYGGA